VNLWPLVYRDARIALAGRLIRETERALRLVFAVHRRWEPDWKWLASESGCLERAPERLVARVGRIMTFADPAHSATECLTLVLDALALAPALAPARYDLDRQRRLVREALQPEALLAQAGDGG